VREKAPDLVGSALLVALGVAFAIGGTGYGVFGEGSRIGPGFMPLVAGVLLVVFGAMIGVEAALHRGRVPSRRVQNMEQGGVEGEEEGGGRTVAVAFGLMLVTVLLIPLLGFLLSFGLLILALVTFVEKEGWLRGILLSASAITVTWLTFVVLLEIPLPPGILGQLLQG
jgi:putative tricarboxylic transport membrane protein